VKVKIGTSFIRTDTDTPCNSKGRRKRENQAVTKKCPKNDERHAPTRRAKIQGEFDHDESPQQERGIGWAVLTMNDKSSYHSWSDGLNLLADGGGVGNHVVAPGASLNSEHCVCIKKELNCHKTVTLIVYDKGTWKHEAPCSYNHKKGFFMKIINALLASAAVCLLSTVTPATSQAAFHVQASYLRCQAWLIPTDPWPCLSELACFIAVESEPGDIVRYWYYGDCVSSQSECDSLEAQCQASLF
jgi:hypothetical protein